MIEKMHNKTNSLAFKIIFALIAISFVLGGIGGGIMMAGNYAAKVNGEEISLQAFNVAKARQQNLLNEQMGERFWDLMDTPEYAQEFNRSVLNQLINEELLRQYTKTLKLGISVEQIKSEIVNSPAFQQNGKFDNNLYQQVLRSNNLSADAYAAIVHEGMLLAQVQEAILNSDFVVPAQQEHLAKLLLQKRQVRLANFPVAAEADKQSVSNEELDAFYKAHPNDFINPEKLTVEYVTISPKDVSKNVQVTNEQLETYYQTNKSQYVTPEEIHLAHIQVATEAEAQAIEQALKNGENFATLAKEKSGDKLSALQGGDLGWSKSGTFPAAFESAANALQKGQFSAPVQVDGNYHIIKMLDRKASVATPLAEVKDKISETIRHELALAEYSTMTREMVNRAFENNGSLDSVAEVAKLAVQKTEPFTINDVPAELNHEKVLKVLFSGELRQNGQNSEAIEIGDEKNPQTMFVRVSQYQAQAAQTFEEAKPALEQAVKYQKAEQALNEKANELVNKLSQGEKVEVDFTPAQELIFVQAQMENPVLAQTVFAMPKPTEKTTYQVARSQNNDIIIVALDQVTDGDISALQPLTTQLEQDNALKLQSELLNDLRQRAKIELNEDFINQATAN